MTMKEYLNRKTMEIVLPTRQIYDQFEMLLRLFAQKHRRWGIVVGEGDLWRQSLMKLITAFWEEALTYRLLWLSVAADAEEVMDNWIDAHYPFLHQEQRNLLKRHVAADTFDEVDLIMGQYIPEMTWKTWTLRAIPHVGHVLEEGEDYRILEWHRIMEERQEEEKERALIRMDQCYIEDLLQRRRQLRLRFTHASSTR